MKYLSTFLFLILLVCSTSAYSAGNQTNVSGSNTSIEGGYTGGATTYERGKNMILKDLIIRRTLNV
jgi:hypothetical protein